MAGEECIPNENNKKNKMKRNNEERYEIVLGQLILTKHTHKIWTNNSKSKANKKDCIN